MTLAVGVIGVGRMGRNHVRVYNELPGVELVGVADADESRAAHIAREYGTAALDTDDLLAAADAVSVAVPSEYHYRIARDALSTGVHALVEKPFVRRVDHGEELIALAERHDCRLQVGHVERFNPAVREIGDVIRGMDVVAVESKRLGPPVDPVPDDDPVMDLMIHDLDVLFSLFGEDVTAASATAPSPEHVLAQLTFADGPTASLTASRCTQKKVRTLTVTAEEALVELDYTDQSIRVHRHSVPEYIEQNGDVRYRHGSIVEHPLVESAEPLRAELAGFRDAVTEGTDPRVTGRDGLRAVEFAQRLQRLAGLVPGEEVEPW
ncbi:Gfo/Idh/MocA family oxidoreductase [Salinirubrum litoreum]|uniref:Gfo/Idh/MocA family oxidoreductase n=1 Tax=Salinirubrum litoreum TaxID=1126234 RepID=A0ABD5RFF1_9EURY